MDEKRFKDIERKYINELDDSIDTLQGDDYLKVDDIGWLIDNFKQQQEQIERRGEQLKIFNDYFKSIHDAAEKWAEDPTDENIANEIVRINIAYMMKIADLDQ